MCALGQMCSRGLLLQAIHTAKDLISTGAISSAPSKEMCERKDVDTCEPECSLHDDAQ